MRDQSTVALHLKRPDGTLLAQLVDRAGMILSPAAVRQLGDRLSGHSDLNFDLSVFDTFGALASGAALAPVTELMDKTAPSRFIEDKQITGCQQFRQVLELGMFDSRLRPPDDH